MDVDWICLRSLALADCIGEGVGYAHPLAARLTLF